MHMRMWGAVLLVNYPPCVDRERFTVGALFADSLVGGNLEVMLDLLLRIPLGAPCFVPSVAMPGLCRFLRVAHPVIQNM